MVWEAPLSAATAGESAQPPQLYTHGVAWENRKA
jgi:hypothetical protein